MDSPTRSITPINDGEQIDVPQIPRNQLGLLKKSMKSVPFKICVFKTVNTYISIKLFGIVRKESSKNSTMRRAKRVHFKDDDERPSNLLDLHIRPLQLHSNHFRTLSDLKHSNYNIFIKI